MCEPEGCKQIEGVDHMKLGIERPWHCPVEEEKQRHCSVKKQNISETEKKKKKE